MRLRSFFFFQAEDGIRDIGVTGVQTCALPISIGRYKVDVAEERIHDINKECIVHKYQMFYLPQNADEIDLSKYDYVVDCIDTITAKIELIKRCHSLHIPIISSMGAANRSEEHTSELQSRQYLVCRLLLE